MALLLGVRHATDPDHVVAVTAIAARRGAVRPALGLAALWGLGHSLTLFVVGAAIVLLGLTVPPRLGLALEFCVAIALVAVGLLNLRGGRHDAGAITSSGRPGLRSFVVGVFHGLAGSAAVALLVLATIRDPKLACLYLVVFGLGTLVGMTAITGGFAAVVAGGARRWPTLGRGVALATGLLSVAFGAWLMVQIGWVDGLFTAAPHWDPH